MPGWKVSGLEPSLEASAYARDQLGLEVYRGTVEEVDFPAQRFDVITLWNVLEHLPDPNTILQRLSGWLKPDGLLVYNTPNLDSLDARLFGQFWIGYELPRHFVVFSRRSLTQLLARSGFKIIDRQCVYGSYALFMSGARFWLRGRSSPPRIYPRLEKVMFSMPLRVAAVPLFWILDALKVTTAPTDLCVKIGQSAL
jgi:SAM-dependent methyltransferase